MDCLSGLLIALICLFVSASPTHAVQHPLGKHCAEVVLAAVDGRSAALTEAELGIVAPLHRRIIAAPGIVFGWESSIAELVEVRGFEKFAASRFETSQQRADFLLQRLAVLKYVDPHDQSERPPQGIQTMAGKIVTVTESRESGQLWLTLALPPLSDGQPRYERVAFYDELRLYTRQSPQCLGAKLTDQERKILAALPQGRVDEEGEFVGRSGIGAVNQPHVWNLSSRQQELRDEFEEAAFLAGWIRTVPASAVHSAQALQKYLQGRLIASQNFLEHTGDQKRENVIREAWQAGSEYDSSLQIKRGKVIAVFAEFDSVNGFYLYIDLLHPDGGISHVKNRIEHLYAYDPDSTEAISLLSSDRKRIELISSERVDYPFQRDRSTMTYGDLNNERRSSQTKAFTALVERVERAGLPFRFYDALPYYAPLTKLENRPFVYALECELLDERYNYTSCRVVSGRVVQVEPHCLYSLRREGLLTGITLHVQTANGLARISYNCLRDMMERGERRKGDPHGLPILILDD